MSAPNPIAAWAGLHTGVALMDHRWTVTWLNAALAEALGVGVRTLRGQPFLSLLDADDAARAPGLVASSGALRLRHARVATLRDDSIVADLDVQALDDAQLLLELHPLAPRTAAPLSETLRGFAHEVKNPLAGLRGAAQLLERRAADDGSRQMAQLVIVEADRLAALADRLLHGDGKPRLAPVNVHAVLERIAELLRAAPGAPRIRDDFDPSLPQVLGDAGRLQQALLNLARNAVEAGAATITLRTRADHGVRLDDQVLRRVLRVDVADDGPGVPDEVRGTLFQPLVSGRADGTGLGLALVREIAREHGGDVHFTSRPGATVFSLYLPLGAAP